MIVPEKLITASDCASIEETRLQIDKIDEAIIELFALRNEYVHEIVRFKSDEASVVAMERKMEVIRKRGIWAAQSGLDQLTFEEIYRLLIDNNIKAELKILNNK